MIELMLAILMIALVTRYLRKRFPLHAVKFMVIAIGFVTWLLFRYWQRDRRK